MKSLFFAIFFIFQIGCKTTDSGYQLDSQGRIKGTFKGYHAIEKILATRLLVKKDRHEFDLGNFLTDTTNKDEGSIEGLPALLGQFEGIGDKNKPTHSHPNGITYLMWYTTMFKLAKAIGTECDPSADTALKKDLAYYAYNPSFASGVQKLCSLVGDKTKTLDQKSARDIWISLMDFGIPDEEYEQWYLSAQGFLRQKNSTAAVTEVYLSLLMNPYFLLVN